MTETLEQRLTSHMQEAMKAHQQRRVDILRTLLAAVKKARIDAAGKPFTPVEELGVLEKQKKQREESIALFQQAGRPDRAAAEQEEIDVIREYLPTPMTEDEVKQIIRDAVAQTGAASIKDMGKVMGIVTPLTKGRYDASAIALLVKSTLGA